jgi:hypothetical protein
MSTEQQIPLPDADADRWAQRHRRRTRSLEVDQERRQARVDGLGHLRAGRVGPEELADRLDPGQRVAAGATGVEVVLHLDLGDGVQIRGEVTPQAWGDAAAPDRVGQRLTVQSGFGSPVRAKARRDGGGGVVASSMARRGHLRRGLRPSIWRSFASLGSVAVRQPGSRTRRPHPSAGSAGSRAQCPMTDSAMAGSRHQPTAIGPIRGRKCAVTSRWSITPGRRDRAVRDAG